MEESHYNQTKENSSNTKLIISSLWIVTLLVAVGLGFLFGQGAKFPDKKTEGASDKNSLGNLYKVEASPSPTISANSSTPSLIPATPTVDSNITCNKSGFAQKWEYLTSYVIKQGDTLQSIVEAELGDASRVNEVLQLNGVSQLIVGSTLYLPPKLITKSNGKIKLLHGKLILKNASAWQLSFNDDKNGQGILIPTFWFSEIKNKDNYKIGDCLDILLDDGFKVFSVSTQ